MPKLAGEDLGSLVEFQSPDEIRRKYPGGVRELADGCTWNIIAGQPTDDSEMALLLARMLTDRGIYESGAALKAYPFWLYYMPGKPDHMMLSQMPIPIHPKNELLQRLLRSSDSI